MAADKQRRAFISYSRMNKEFATKLARGLRSAGYPVWFDLLDIPTGARWDDEVEKALRECSIFMIILTPASIGSENVKDEIGYAIDHGKRILPVLLEECDVPLRLRRFQYVDFTTKSFEEGFESAKELLGDLIEEASVPVAAKPPVAEAPIESKPEPVKTKPAPALPVKKIEPVSVAPIQKRPASKGLMIGIVVMIALVAILAVAGIGVGTLLLSRSSPTQSSSASNSSGQVNALNVNRVEYDKGSWHQAFVQGQSGTWFDVSVGDDGSYTDTQYTEIGRDESSVYLLDSSKNYNIQIDLNAGTVFEDYNDGNGKKQRNIIKGVFITPTGYAVRIVRYSGGEFAQTDSQSWTEKTENNDEFHYLETGRDQWSVYLYDESRNFNVHLDLYQMQTLLDINDGNGQSPLYQIISAEN